MAFFGLASLPTVWVPMEPASWAITAMAALMILGGYSFSVMVMRVGEISFVAPFRYTSLIWALILGWLLFGEWPDALTLTGATIVVMSGLFMLYRQGKIARTQR